MNTGPLTGIKVIDLTYYVAGPGSAKILADWGADVVKIEPPEGEPGRSTGLTLGVPSEDDFNPYFGTYNMNKRAIVLNLKNPEGRAVMDRLLAWADVFITSFRPGALKRLGLDYETVSVNHPKIIWASVNGFGEKGPEKDRPGFDTVAFWARSGAMLDLTEKDTAPLIPILAFGDASAACSLSGGIAAALYQRVRTGKGCKIMLALYAQAIWNVGAALVSTQVGDVYPKSRKSPIVPMTNSYRTSDGHWLFVTVLDDRLYPIFLEKVLLLPDLAADPRYNNIVGAKKNTVELTALIEKEFGAHTREEMIRRLIEADIAHETINHVADVLTDPQAAANHYVLEVTQPNGEKLLSAQTPIKFNTTEVSIRHGVPLPGGHTEEVLSELGYASEEIQKLIAQKTIKCGKRCLQY
jgi:crotonobetainyl-CoA:carnitine CoA-transferase CaiB-like acyl-CoA transferase